MGFIYPDPLLIKLVQGAPAYASDNDSIHLLAIKRHNRITGSVLVMHVAIIYRYDTACGLIDYDELRSQSG